MNQKNHWELMEPNESCTRFFDVEFSLAINRTTTMTGVNIAAIKIGDDPGIVYGCLPVYHIFCSPI